MIIRTEKAKVIRTSLDSQTTDIVIETLIIQIAQKQRRKIKGEDIVTVTHTTQVAHMIITETEEIDHKIMCRFEFQ